ncbi:MAG: MFS transporter [Gammaproteobacteria bacterium]
MTARTRHQAGENPDAGREDEDRMSPLERRASISLAGIYTLRLLGLFMILPVFSLHADEYPDFSPARLGLAIGIYGLTQACFQVPFGLLSDRVGRKRVISGGLIVFVIGSVMAALADTMTGVIVGRAIQGTGAIAAAVLALTADLTREEQRTKAMAIIGVSIGFAFAVAMVLGPVVAEPFGMSGLFWFTGALAALGLVVLHTGVPDPAVSRFHRDTEPVPSQFARILRNADLVRLDVGILVLHLVMTAIFVALPLALRDAAGLAETRHWLFYLVVLLAAVLLMAPFVRYADKANQLKPVFLGAVAVMMLALAGLGVGGAVAGLLAVGVLMTLFFASSTILEATLPSIVSRIAPAAMKGTALGVYSTSQYLGAFLGGWAGGLLYEQFGGPGVYLTCAGLCVVWFAVAFGMRNPPPLSIRLLNLGAVTPGQESALEQRLKAVVGVVEASVIAEDGMAYLKVDRRRLDHAALRAFSAAAA